MIRKDTRSRKQQILFITHFSILLAIEAIVCFTPLGSIPLFGIVATLAMVPVIITAVLLGTKAGTLMGFFAGLFSFIVWSFMPPQPAIAFLFTPLASPGNFFSLLICFIPRILVGTVAGFVHQLFGKKLKSFNYKDYFQYGAAGILGSLTNTLLVVTGMVLFFGPKLVEEVPTFSVLLVFAGGIILTNGILEAIIAFILTIAICKPLYSFYLKQYE